MLLVCMKTAAKVVCTVARQTTPAPASTMSFTAARGLMATQAWLGSRQTDEHIKKLFCYAGRTWHHDVGQHFEQPKHRMVVASC